MSCRALIRKAHEAKLAGLDHVTIWGTGSPRREFLFSEDCADALVFLLKNYEDYEHVNVGSGEDIAILDLMRLVAEVVGFEGRIETDPSKPDGTPRKLMSNAKLAAMGWKPANGTSRRNCPRLPLVPRYPQAIERHGIRNRERRASQRQFSSIQRVGRTCL